MHSLHAENKFVFCDALVRGYYHDFPKAAIGLWPLESNQEGYFVMSGRTMANDLSTTRSSPAGEHGQSVPTPDGQAYTNAASYWYRRNKAARLYFDEQMRFDGCAP